MARTGVVQAVMSRGEVTPLIGGRPDLQDYQLGLSLCQNFLLLKTGGVTRMPGTADLAALADATQTAVLRPFIFNQSQAYALEFGEYTIRFFTVDGQVLDTGVPVEVVSPYALADLPNISITSLGDVVYIFCAGHQPRKLTRTSDVSWALSAYDPTGGPWLPATPSATRLRPSGTGHAIPEMTGLSAPSGTAYSYGPTSTTATAWNAFDRDPGTALTSVNPGNGYLQYDYGVGNSEVITGYFLQAPMTRDEAAAMPISWSIEGSPDAVTWTVLDTHTGTSDWWHGEVRHYDIGNTVAFRYIRMAWDAGGRTGSATGDGVRLAQWCPLLSPATQTPFNLTASSVAGLNGGAGFSADDVGRPIRLLASDGTWRHCVIEAYTSSTVVTITVHGPSPLPNTNAVTLWQLGAWGETPGWPKHVAKHKSRLASSATDTEPRTTWLSVSAIFEDMSVSSPLVDDDAMTLTDVAGDMDDTLWLTSNGEDLILGTVGGVRVLTKQDAGLPLSPNNVDQTGKSSIRVGDVTPVWVDKVLVFANKQRKALGETAFSLDEGGYVERELTVLAEHLFLGKIKEMAMQASPVPVLWVVLDDGSLRACVYDRPNKIFGVSRVVFPGTAVSVESVCVIPGSAYDVPMLVVKRTVNGTATYRVERVAQPYRADDEDTPHPVYLASSATYSGGATSTITGLTHLEGETVAVYDITAGGDLGDATVASGQITVPGGGTVTSALVGLRMTSSIKMLPTPRVASNGEYAGVALRTTGFALDVFETYGMEYAGPAGDVPITTEADAALAPDPPALHTGTVEVYGEGGWSDRPQPEFFTDRAYPATIRAVQVSYERGS